MTDQVNLLAISGSLRAGSFNSALLRAAADIAPPRTKISIYDRLGDLPPYNADMDREPAPEAVADLRRRIADADGLLIATPEYNYSIPGVLKNAIDWASRPVATNVLRHKPVAQMGAAPGNFGTVRAQLALRQVWLWTESRAVVKPEVHVFRAAERFNERGHLTDPTTRELVKQLLEELTIVVDDQRRANRDRLAAGVGTRPPDPAWPAPASAV
jgi:chromate reductase